jgi:hypothetical protein
MLVVEKLKYFRIAPRIPLAPGFSAVGAAYL